MSLKPSTPPEVRESGSMLKTVIEQGPNAQISRASAPNISQASVEAAKDAELLPSVAEIFACKHGLQAMEQRALEIILGYKTQDDLDELQRCVRKLKLLLPHRVAGKGGA